MRYRTLRYCTLRSFIIGRVERTVPSNVERTIFFVGRREPFPQGNLADNDRRWGSADGGVPPRYRSTYICMRGGDCGAECVCG